MAKGIKTGGREQGTPNRDRKELLELLGEKYPNYHPVIALAEIAHNSKNEVLRFQAHKEVAKYVSPQLKAIEVIGEGVNNEIPIFPTIVVHSLEEKELVEKALKP